VRGDHLYGPVKTSELKKAAASLGMDFKRSVVYANDSSDEAHMRLFGTAVAVNPRPKLRLLAERHRWRIVHW
jgi:phosphoserine phosphatase